jgi:hypothetical protein
MSIVAPEQTAAPSTATPPPLGVPPRIAANRRYLVRQLPSLSFTVSSGGLPYWEVLLFTDRSLIDPSNASRRTPSSFYSSRQDGGLRRAAASGDDVFLVPSAVLRGFAAATPKPTVIYYTIAAYATPDGGSPAFPEPPQQLTSDAPSVGVSPDFTPDTLDKLLGVSSARLRVFAQAADTTAVPAQQPVPAQVPAPAPVPAPPPTTAIAPSPAEDAAAGEDGYSYLTAHPELANGGQQQQPELSGHNFPTGGGHREDQPYDDGYGAYDDGWATHEQRWTETQGASFPAGFPEPKPLAGEVGNGWSHDAAEAAELAGVALGFPYGALDEPGVAVAPADAPIATAAPPTMAGRPLVLTIDDKRAIIEKIAGTESGNDRFGAVNTDGEFRGRFGASHPAYQHHHIGLSYGIVQFTQESGNLGRLLVMMRDRDEAAFRQIFGAHADELIQVTTADGPPSSESPGGRSARTQPVDGIDLWEEPWIARFRQAGQMTAFQAAQNELAASAFLDPMVGFAGDLGLDTDRALTMVIDRSVQMGVAGARHWIIAAAGPISTPALRQQALSAIGYDDLGSFQRAWGLPIDNLWGPLTHAGLVGALRQLGGSSPIPLPTVDQMLDAMVRRADADNAAWGSRVKRLRAADGFTDHPYAR